MIKTERPQLTFWQYSYAIWRVAKLAFSISPWAVGFKFFGAVLDAILPLITTYFAALTTTELVATFNGVAGAKQTTIFYVLITAGLGLITVIWASLDQYIQQVVRFRIESKVSDMMYEQFTLLDFWRYDDKQTADLYDRAKNFSTFFAWIFDRLSTVLQAAISLLGALVAIAYVNPLMGLLILGAVIPGLLIQFKISRANIKHWNTNVDIRRKRSHIEWKMIQPKQIAELRIYGMVDYLINLRKQLRDKDEKVRLDFEKRFIGWRILGDIIEVVAEIGSLIWIVLLIAARAQPVGQFIYVQQVVSRALNSASRFVSELSTIDEDLSNLKDYDVFMRLPRAIRGTRQARDPREIVFKNVYFTYPKQSHEVLRNINMSIRTGSHVAIVGENGAGKSTFIKLLIGLYEPTKGIITIDDQPLQDYDVRSWHAQLAVLMQDFLKYEFATIGENVWFGDTHQSQNSSRVQDALAQSEATDIVEKLPHKLDTPASNWFEEAEGTELSGGQWQRIALARNFFRKAPIIILDEPTSAIDALAEAKIFRHLFAKDNHKTVITISHRLTTVEKADIIYVFKDGRIVESGTHTELVAKDGEYCRMFADQL